MSTSKTSQQTGRIKDNEELEMGWDKHKKKVYKNSVASGQDRQNQGWKQFKAEYEEEGSEASSHEGVQTQNDRTPGEHLGWVGKKQAFGNDEREIQPLS